MRRSGISVLLLVGLAISQPPATASECAIENVASLLNRSRNVVLADVVSLSIKGVTLEYRINVIEPIKGNAPPTLTLRFKIGTPGRPPERMARFSVPESTDSIHRLHASARFWLNQASSGMLNEATCTTSFELRRGRYLMFLDEPYHVKAFEPVLDLNDPWYQTVKTMVSDSKILGRAVNPTAFLKMFHAGYTMQCLRPGLKARAPRLLFGNDVSRNGIYPVVEFGGADPCKRPKPRDLRYLILFKESHDEHPVGVEIEGCATKSGRLKFVERYGDVVLTERTFPLSAVKSSLRR